jgi:hypothetical protein
LHEAINTQVFSESTELDLVTGDLDLVPSKGGYSFVTQFLAGHSILAGFKNIVVCWHLLFLFLSVVYF